MGQRLPISQQGRRRIQVARLVGLLSLSAALLCVASPARAWSQNEHFVIADEALRILTQSAANGDAVDRHTLAVLRELWAAARQTAPSLCEQPDAARASCEAVSEDAPICIRMADLPMLAADHSCDVVELGELLRHPAGPLGQRCQGDEPSPSTCQLLRTIYRAQCDTDEILREEDDADDRAVRRLVVRRDLDVAMQIADERYLEIARDNVGHFALTRSIAERLPTYLRRSTDKGQPLNTTALFAVYHVAALSLAEMTRWLPSPEREDVMQRALMTEALALHYLQDAFSAGHFVGAPEQESLRMGTHDHYSEHGVETTTWAGHRYIAQGDAFLSLDDRIRAGEAMAESLRQLAFATRTPNNRVQEPPLDASAIAGLAQLRGFATAHWRFDSCSGSAVPATFATACARTLNDEGSTAYQVVEAVVRLFPVPVAHRPNGDSLITPFYNELGPFWPISATISYTPVHGYVGADRISYSGSVTLGLIGLGYGLDGVLSKYKDGLTSLEVLTAARIEELKLGSVGIGFRVRAPWAIVPGDAVVWAGPFLAENTWGTEQARVASRGKLIPDTALTSDFHLQFDVGRELAVLWHWDRTAACRSPDDCDEGDDLRFARWEMTIPVFSVRWHAFRRAAAQDLALRLGLRIGHTTEDFNFPGAEGAEYLPSSTYLGLVIEGQSATRFYLDR